MSPFVKVASTLATGIRHDELKRVLFCSAAGGEGTTSVLLHTAKLLAVHYGIRTLVVELTWQRPAFASVFDIEADRSLNAFRQGRCSIGDCVQTTPDGLAYVPIATEALETSPGALTDLVTQISDGLADRFDCLLFDAPPIVENADTLLVGTVLDGMVLVVESGRTRAEVIKRMKRDLAMRNISVLGAVLTKQRYRIPGWIYHWLMK